MYYVNHGVSDLLNILFKWVWKWSIGLKCVNQFLENMVCVIGKSKDTPLTSVAFRI